MENKERELDFLDGPLQPGEYHIGIIEEFIQDMQDINFIIDDFIKEK